MTRNPALERLVEDERRGDVWTRRVLGVPVWPLERLHHFRVHLLFSQMGEDAPLERRTNPVRNLAERTVTSVRDLSRGGPGSRRGRDIWVLSSSNYRRKDERGEYQVAFAEHLRRQLGERVLFIERNHANLPLQHREDVLFVDATLIGAEAVGRTVGPLLAQTPLGSAARGAESPTAAAVLCQHAVYTRMLLALARDWVRSARPKAVFVLNGYHLFIPFQIAVREAGIPLIELQHGIIHEGHPGYVFHGVPELSHIPDHLLVFGRHFGELLDRESPRWTGRWTVGGQPWLKTKRRGIDELPDSAFDTVVAFSQPHQPVRESLRTLLPELRAELPAHLHLVLKPHPRELDASEYYGALPGVTLASPRDDTFDLLRRCRLAVSPYSTVAFETLAFRCRTAVLRSSLFMEDFQALTDQGAFILTDGARQLADLASRPLTESRHDDLANRLFGVHEAEPDFERLIHDVARAPRFPVNGG